MPDNEPLRITLPADIVEHLIAEAAARLRAEADQRAAHEAWMTADQAALHLGCARQRIYDLVHARRIPHRREGGRLLFKRSELDSWLDDTCVRAA